MSAPQRKPATPAADQEGSRKRYQNKELMIAAGSKTGAYDIEAPNHWQFVLKHARDANERGMAWVKSKTTAKGHDSPYCVDEHGNPLYAEHMAVELGWSPRTALNILCILQKQGRIRLEKGKRIWYRAEFEALQGPNAVYDRVHGHWSTYVVDFIGKLPNEQKQAAEERLSACLEWEKTFLADGAAALRSIVDRFEDTTLLEIGIPKKRLKKRREAESKWVQLQLKAEPEFVHGHGDFVQTANLSSYKPESDSVQTTPLPSSNGKREASLESPVLFPATATIKSESGQAFSGVVPSPEEKTLACSQIPVDGKRHWHARLHGFLKTLPIGTVLEAPMFQRIAAPLTEELLEQFKTEARKASANIRGWAGYEAIAKQVAARGLVTATAVGSQGKLSFTESVMVETQRRIDKRRKF